MQIAFFKTLRQSSSPRLLFATAAIAMTLVIGSLSGAGCSGCSSLGVGSAGSPCAKAADCLSKVCTAGTCAAPTCQDGIRNGQETDTDCGHYAFCLLCDIEPTCPVCKVGQACANAEDCEGGYCKTGAPDAGDSYHCGAPTCSDGVADQDETGIDCGGAACKACEIGFRCKRDADCTTKICALDGVYGICLAPPVDMAGLDLTPPNIDMPVTNLDMAGQNNDMTGRIVDMAGSDQADSASPVSLDLSTSDAVDARTD